MVCALAVSSATARADVGGLLPYEPHPVTVPKDAPYLRSDGSVYIVGDDGTQEVMDALDALFIKTHPGIKITLLLKGSSTGIGGLTAGVSAMAPMGRPGWPDDLAAFKDMYGYMPTDILIGYDGFTHPKHKSPPAVYVNAKNPLTGLTMAQVARIFTSGSGKGDITHWNQLGLQGAWAHREIHLYGPRDDGALATTLRKNLLGNRPFPARYETFDHLADVVKAVEQDPYGIGLVGFFDANTVPDVKLVPLATADGKPYVLPSYENVAAGSYPFASGLRIYVNRHPGAPLDPFVKEYLRMVLSREGQAIVAAGKDTEQGLVPLDPATVAAELAALN